MNEPAVTPHRPRLALCAVLALLLVLGLAACGSSSNSNSTTSEATSAQKAGGGAGSEGAMKQGGSGGEGKAQSGSGGGGSAEPGSGARSEEAAEFHPKPHHDSGGGSAQFMVKGGDNSVQEYGEEASESELQAAAAALHGFLDARATGNWAAACGYLAKSVTESFEQLAAQAKGGEGGGCARILEKLTNPAAKGAMKAEAAKADIGSLRVQGGRSFVIYSGPGGTVLAMPMATEGGAWKVASLAGTPLS